MPRAVIAEELRTQTAQVARIDGAVSGTPFLIALIPGYLSYLREEGRMVLRTAALYGRDPRELETSAEALVLRGVHPTVDVAREALENVRDVPLPEKPVKRRSVRTWVHSITVLLIFGGFLSAPSDEREESAHPWLKASFGFVIGAAIWVTTWVLPATFMVAMAWGCETHARQLGRRALLFYDGDADSAQAAIAAAKTARGPRARQTRDPARDAPRPVDRRSDRLRRLRRSRPLQHRHQLGRRARRARRGLPRPRRVRPRQPAMTDTRTPTPDDASGRPDPGLQTAALHIVDRARLSVRIRSGHRGTGYTH